MPQQSPRRKALVLGDDLRSMIAVVRSLGRGGVEVHIGWQPSDSPVASSRYVHTAHTLPPYAEDHAWKGALIDLMTREHFDLVIPCSDPTQIPLQRHRTEFEPHGKIYLLDDKIFEIITDKLQVNALARSAGVQLPREQVVHSISEVPDIKARFNLPIVLKPGSSFDPWVVGERRTVRKAFAWDDFATILDKMLAYGPVAVQENFIGQGVGVEFLLDRGEPLLEFQHLRLHEPLHGGGSYYRKGVAVNPALREAALGILRPLKYTGVAMAEYKVDPATGHWAFIEINGRFWGSLPLAIASGVDFPLALFKLLVDRRTDFRHGYRTGLCCRYWTGDFNWQLANVRANRSDPTLATCSLPTVFRETVVNIFTFRERSDTFTLDDPKPGFVELCQLARSAKRRLFRVARLRWLQSRLVRRRLRVRALTALQHARTVAFVCKGNICRSPFALQVAKGLLTSDRTCISVGYYPKANRPPPAAAVTAAARLGIDMSAHRSVQLTEDHVRSADAIFVFDYENYERLLFDYDCRNKLHFLGALCPSGPLWIDDPYGQDVDYFVATYERIREALTVPLQSIPFRDPPRAIGDT